MSLITINSEKETLKAEIQRLKRNFRSERDSTWRQFDRMPYAALSPKQEAPALIDLLVNCNVKLESEPEGYRLYWNGSRWVVSNGVKLQEFAKLNDAIVKFTELIYT